MEDEIERALDKEIIGDIVVDELEMRIAGEVGDVVGTSGNEVIHDDNVETFRDSRSQKCDPKNPAPPVMRARGMNFSFTWSGRAIGRPRMPSSLSIAKCGGHVNRDGVKG